MVAHQRPPRRRQAPPSRTLRVTVLSAASAAVAVTVASPVAAEPDSAASRGDTAARVDGLFAEATRAVEAYNGTAERVDELREEVERRQDQLARGQEDVNRKRRSLGAAAAAHYRAGGVDPSLALLLSEDPDAYLTRAAAVDRAHDRQADELRDLRAAQRALDQWRAEAMDTLEELEREKDALSRRKQRVQRTLDSARRQHQRLSDEEREERERTARAAREAEESGRADDAPGGAQAPSGRAAAAVEAARSALGKPYAWGQSGPHGFDCSGLTQWAYRQAGVALPRTSQAQAGAGRRVSLGEARPGDLVIYRGDASHVALYVGDGRVIHAPHPGTQVRYDAATMMPVNAVIRP